MRLTCYERDNTYTRCTRLVLIYGVLYVQEVFCMYAPECGYM